MYVFLVAFRQSASFHNADRRNINEDKLDPVP